MYVKAILRLYQNKKMKSHFGNHHELPLGAIIGDHFHMALHRSLGDP